MEITPQEKARELFDKFYALFDRNKLIPISITNQIINTQEACELVVDEILDVLESGSLYMEHGDSGITSNEFWIDVKTEINMIFQKTNL